MSNKLKVALVIPSLQRGGAERVVVNLANYMARNLGHAVTVIHFCPKEINDYKPFKEVSTTCIILQLSFNNLSSGYNEACLG